MVTPGSIASIFKIFRIVFVPPLSAPQGCPVCWTVHFPHNPRTLQIFATLDGDFLFRCPVCESNLNTLELVRRALKVTFQEASARLYDAGVIDHQHGEEECASHERQELFRRAFAAGVPAYLHALDRRQVSRRSFGEWSLIHGNSLREIFPSMSWPRDARRPEYLVSRFRNAFGHPIRLQIWSTNGLLITTIAMGLPEPIGFSTTPWIDSVNLDEVIVCASELTAARIEKVVWSWPKEAQVAVLYPKWRSAPAFFERSPFLKVWNVVREDEDLDPALSLWQSRGTVLRTLRLAGKREESIPESVFLPKEVICNDGLPETLPLRAEEICRGANSLRESLNQTLFQPYISAEAKRRLLTECAARTGRSVADLLRETDAGGSPYAVISKGRKFVCRDDIYLMQDRRGQWQRISNFCIKVLDAVVDRRGDAGYELLLVVDGRPSKFQATSSLLANHARLWKAASRCAALSGLPELAMPNGQHRALLPCLITGSKGLEDGGQ